MRECILRSIVLAIALTGARGATAERPISVSPGSTREVTIIDQRCPAFSWGAIEQARGYELVVYRLREDVGAPLQATEPVLRAHVRGRALSWTPSMARCLPAGGRYAWLVRANVDDGSGSWSEPRLFEIASGPTQAELRQALTVLLDGYLAQGGDLQALGLGSAGGGSVP